MDSFDIVWQPSARRAAATNTAAFMRAHGIGSVAELGARSSQDPEWFWEAVVEFLGIPFDRPWRAVRDTSRGHQWSTWFVGGSFNLSRACVDRWAEQEPGRVALRSEKETGEIRELTFGGLRDKVSRLAGALSGLGVGRGDPVAVYLPMGEEAVVSLLAVARLGAIFIPVFSGYGPEAVSTRLEDPRPKVVVCANGFQRRGKLVEMKEIADRAAGAVGDVEHILVVDYTGRADTPMTEGRDLWWHDLVDRAEPLAPLPTGSEDPVLIAYTSGTTGRPKGAVHVQAGFTVKVATEGAFHAELTREDVAMWATDMGWIMGPWIVIAALGNGAALATYDGAPDHPGPDRLWQVAANLGVTFLGISPTLIRALQPHGAEQARRHDLSRLRSFGSTGEPWNPDPWWWLFEAVGERTRPIINISGGTEIGAVILGVNILQGLKPTSLGGPSFGVDADVYDAEGKSIRGEVGELVIRGSWPGMTRGFWNEPERYLETYWHRFPDTWVHGDWASIDQDGFWFLHGRSDDTLNVAGKRIGPAEIESVVVALPEVVMAAAIGIPDPVKGEAIALYVVPAPGAESGEEMRARVEAAVTETLGKSFRPALIRMVPDLPRTRSAKIMRRVVKALALGHDTGDLSSLENPESLEGIAPLA
ncbi:MAG TPA: AMP-binding protein [Acidimicrobiia bacterium]|nr:AMP-binding protein [Acidimicrobiia bacterium]